MLTCLQINGSLVYYTGILYGILDKRKYQVKIKMNHSTLTRKKTWKYAGNILWKNSKFNIAYKGLFRKTHLTLFTGLNGFVRKYFKVDL